MDTLIAMYITLYLIMLIETTFNPFAKRPDPDKKALVRAAWSGSPLYAYGYMIIYDPKVVDLMCKLFVLCTNVKLYLYKFS